jgi:CBS domain-containing protein
MAPLKVRDMMTPNVKTLYADDSLNTADWEMAVSDIRHLVVIDRERHVVGIVSDRDVLRMVAEQPHARHGIERIMTHNVLTVASNAPAADAAAQLVESKCGALPVVDEEGRLIGIVTTTDFVELARRALVGHDVNQPHVRA